MYLLKLTIIILLNYFQFVACARIFGYFYVPSPSHEDTYRPIWTALAEKGHNVTIFTTDSLNSSTNGLTLYSLKSSYQYNKKHSFMNAMKKELSAEKIVFNVYNWIIGITEFQFRNEIVQAFLKDNTTEFDVILIETTNPILYAWAGKFKVPVIGISSIAVSLNSHDAVGNPTHPILGPDKYVRFSAKPTFFKKVKSTLYNIWYRILYYNYFLPRCDSVARKYFGKDMPYLGDLEKNVSLLMLNVNPILHPIRPNVPAIIEISQMHIKPEQPLPEDLQTFLDSSTEGVVYFSLGSNIKSANLNENIRNVIIEAFSELPYKVLWKWETDYLPNQPKNVLTKKWFPQQDILRHPNIKVFVTQGGLQSIEEAVTYGVPLIGLPIFADQPLNVNKIVEMGIAKELDYNQMTKNVLRDTIIEVATNEKFRRNVKKFGDLLKDQPMTGVEKAVWWIEYVIRHNGAKHLRSPAVDMPWYEYFLLDVFMFLFFICVIFVYCIYFLIYFILRTIQNKRKIKTS